MDQNQKIKNAHAQLIDLGTKARKLIDAALAEDGDAALPSFALGSLKAASHCIYAAQHELERDANAQNTHHEGWNID